MSDKYLDFFQAFADTDEKLEVKYAHEVLGEKHPSFSTGSYLIDDAIGSCLGYPLGRLIQIYGPAGSGKTLMAMLGIIAAQKASPTSKQLWIDAEGTFDQNWLEKLGGDSSCVVRIEDELAVSGRRCFEMLLGVPKEDAKGRVIGKSKEGLLDKVANGELDYNYMVYDSLGALKPPIEESAKVGQHTMAAFARFMSKECKTLSLEVKKANIPFIFINHKRDTLSLYGPDHTSSGGNSWHHFLSLNIYVDPVMRKDSQILDEQEKKIGHKARVHIEKTKFGPWPRTVEVDLNFNLGIVGLEREVFELASNYNILTSPAQGSFEFNGMKWRGKDNMIKEIASDKGLFDSLLASINEIRAKELAAQKSLQESKKQANIETEKKGRKRGPKSSNEEQITDISSEPAVKPLGND